MTGIYALEVEGLTISFGGLTAVDNVNLTLQRGGICALLGPNGAGKTTLFNLIAGAYHASSGAIRFNGEDVTRWRPHRRCRAGIARTFQITRPFLGLTVEENVMCGALVRVASLREASDAARELLDAVGLVEKADEYAAILSTGQRKRLELARALATRPQLLLIDEISGGIDQPSLPQLTELVRKVNQMGVTLVLIDHNMQFIRGLADRVLFLDAGKLLYDGNFVGLWDNPVVREIYIGGSRART